jgi:hypothetical protein
MVIYLCSAHRRTHGGPGSLPFRQCPCMADGAVWCFGRRACRPFRAAEQGFKTPSGFLHGRGRMVRVRGCQHGRVGRHVQVDLPIQATCDSARGLGRRLGAVPGEDLAEGLCRNVGRRVRPRATVPRLGMSVRPVHRMPWSPRFLVKENELVRHLCQAPPIQSSQRRFHPVDTGECRRGWRVAGAGVRRGPHPATRPWPRPPGSRRQCWSGVGLSGRIGHDRIAGHGSRIRCAHRPATGRPPRRPLLTPEPCGGLLTRAETT